MDIPLGTENPVGELFEEGRRTATESVYAGSLVEGETINYEGALYEVDSIEDAGEADEDRILLTIKDPHGNLADLDLDLTDTMDRLLTMGDTFCFPVAPT